MFLLEIILRIIQSFNDNMENVTAWCILMVKVMPNYFYDTLYVTVFDKTQDLAYFHQRCFIIVTGLVKRPGSVKLHFVCFSWCWRLLRCGFKIGVEFGIWG